MGADMLLCSIGFKARQRLMFDEQWAATAFDTARRAIESIAEGKNALIPDGYDSLAEYKQVLLDDLKDVEHAVFAHDRQAGIVEGGEGIILLVSGGLSWGDSPTELYESMCRLVESGVCPDARWPERHPAQPPAPPGR